MTAFSKEYLNEVADAVLTDCYGQSYGSDLISIDIDDFATKYLGLDVCYAKLSDDGRLLGLTTYSDVDVELHIYDSVLVKHLRKGSVLVDSNLLNHNQDGRRRFTLAHEASHQIIYRLEEASDQKRYKSFAARGKVYSCRDLSDADHWREWQANVLASSLLMPKSIVGLWMFRLNSGKPIVRYGFMFNNADKQVLRNISKALGVSSMAMQIRLSQLGYLLQRPTYEFVDVLNLYPDESEAM